MIPPPDCSLKLLITNNTTNIVNVSIQFETSGQSELKMNVCPNSITVVNDILRFDDDTTIQTNRQKGTDPSCGIVAEDTNKNSGLDFSLDIEYNPSLSPF